MKKCILFLFFIGLLTTGISQIDPILASQLQAALNSKVAAGNKGVSASVILANGQTWSGTAGVNHQNIPITDSTLFHGASTTKLNIAVLLLLLTENGMLDLDAPWSNYVSLSASFNPSITIRQLLNHTSGIADYLETAATLTNVTNSFSYSYTPQYILQNIVSGTPLFQPGTNFSYSSSNYVLAALVAEAVTGNPVQTELRNRIWAPLGMKHTYFGATESYTENTAGVWWDFGNGQTNYSSQPMTAILSYGYGGANIVSCPKDEALLLHALLTNQLVNSQSLSQMLTLVPASFNSWTKGYGLGIHRNNVQSGDTVIGHDGYYTNMTDMFHSKKYGFTLVTMTNTQTGLYGIYNTLYGILRNYYIAAGLHELESSTPLSLYPNPATKTIWLDVPVKESSTVQLYNMMGQLVLQKKNYRSLSTIDVELLEKGMYIYKIITDKGIYSGKLLKE